MRITFDPAYYCTAAKVWPVIQNSSYDCTYYEYIYYGSNLSALIPRFTDRLYVEFVKVGAISSGGTLSGQFGTSTSSSYYWSLNGQVSWLWSTSFNIIPTQPTCAVISPSIMVPLNNIPIRTFTGVGSTSPNVPLMIQLQCEGGSSTNHVYVTLTDETNSANTSTTLSLALGSTAKGIGIQVLNGTTVLGYGPDSSVPGNTNQWFAGTVGAGGYNIPLTARYVQTTPTVEAGTANGIASFTMSYQ